MSKDNMLFADLSFTLQEMFRSGISVDDIAKEILDATPKELREVLHGKMALQIIEQ